VSALALGLEAGLETGARVDNLRLLDNKAVLNQLYVSRIGVDDIERGGRAERHVRVNHDDNETQWVYSDDAELPSIPPILIARMPTSHPSSDVPTLRTNAIPFHFFAALPPLCRYLADVLPGVGHGDLARLIGIKPDLALTRLEHAGGQALLNAEVHHLGT